MRVLDSLASLKGRFGRDAARHTITLLDRLSRTRIPDPVNLIRFHEIVLYLRAYPQSPRVLRLSDRILHSFSSRLSNRPSEPFENPEISGIAGTSLATNFGHDVVKSLLLRHAKSISIDWDAYDRADRLGYVLSELVPESREDFGILSHPDARRWFAKLRGGLKTLVEKLDSRTYDLLEIPLLWRIGDSPAARTHTRIPRSVSRSEIFYHDRFLKRSEISLATEFASPKIPVTTLSRAQTEKILATILDTSAVRYRELYGFTYPDRSRVRHADLGRGMAFYFFGVDPKRKLIRDYHAGMYFKNGVPIGYVELLSTNAPSNARSASARSIARSKSAITSASSTAGGIMEVGFNLYYTFRESETAWLYARLLKIFHERLGAHRFTIDPYQLGHENEEAIESGAFWFYRKLGFRSTSREISEIIAREEQKISSDPSYRTRPAILRNIAAAPLLYDVPQIRRSVP